MGRRIRCSMRLYVSWIKLRISGDFEFGILEDGRWGSGEGSFGS